LAALDDWSEGAIGAPCCYTGRMAQTTPARSIFVTGAASGIGRATALLFAERGWRVIGTMRHPEHGSDLAGAERVTVLPLDVTDAAEIEATARRALALSPVDVLFNNAGYGLAGPLEGTSDEQIRREIDTNLLGSIHVIRAALPHLRAQGHGRILQVSSAGGQTTYPNFSYYHASKWGIEGYCETLAQEVAPFGIGVTIVEPGATPTGFGGALDTAPAIDAYDATPAGDVRRAIAGDQFPLDNDAEKIAAAMIASAQRSPAPLRLPLGRDTYEDVRASYVRRLEELDAHRDVALSVLRDGAAV